jgi:hypothetical protein
MTPRDLIASILSALGPAHAPASLTLSMALRMLAEDVTDAEFESGMKLRDSLDTQQWLHDLADAAKERAKREAVSA